MRSVLSFEHLRPGLKALDLVCSVAFEAAQNMFNGFFFGLLAVVSVLGKEIVGVADQLFFDGNGPHVAGGQRQIKLLDIIRADPNPHMAFADQSKSRQSDIFHHLPAQDAVANIGVPAIAANSRAVCFQDPNIVQHGGICDKFKIRLQMGDLFGSHKGLTCHMFAMGHQDIKCLRSPAAGIR